MIVVLVPRPECWSHRQADLVEIDRVTGRSEPLFRAPREDSWGASTVRRRPTLDGIQGSVPAGQDEPQQRGMLHTSRNWDSSVAYERDVRGVAR